MSLILLRWSKYCRCSFCRLFNLQSVLPAPPFGRYFSGYLNLFRDFYGLKLTYSEILLNMWSRNNFCYLVSQLLITVDFRSMLKLFQSERPSNYSLSPFFLVLVTVGTPIPQFYWHMYNTEDFLLSFPTGYVPLELFSHISSMICLFVRLSIFIVVPGPPLPSHRSQRYHVIVFTG